MAITVSSVLNSGDGTDRTGPGNPYVTGTIATAGTSSDIHVLAIIGIMGTSVTPPAPTAVTQSGVTWTKDTRPGGGTGVLGFKTTAANRFSASLWYTAGPLPTGVGSTISIDFGTNAMIGCSWQLLRISAGDVSGGVLAGIAQLATAVNETLATAGTISPTLAAPVTAASRSFYFCCYNTNDANNTVESGHTQIARLPTQTLPNVGMVSGWHATTFDTSPTVTNSTGVTNAYGSIAFEIKAAPIAVSGTVPVTSVATAAPKLRAGVSGTVPVVSVATASPKSRRGASGTVAVVSTATAAPKARMRVSGTVAVVSNVTASVSVYEPPATQPTTVVTRQPTPISFVLGKMDGGENWGPPLEEMIEPQITLLWGPFEGSLTFRYPVGGANWEQLLVEKQEIIVLADGIERNNCRFYVQKVTFDALEKQPVESVAHPLVPDATIQQKQPATITVVCDQLWKRFDEYTIQPLTGAVVTHDKIWEAGTPAGEVPRWLVEDAHEHNALAEIARDFDDTHTSDDGDVTPWDKTVELTIPRGTTALPVMQWLWDDHAVEFTMRKRTLRAYNWNTLPVNWANADGEKILLASGRDFLDAPVVVDHTEKANFVTVYGDEGRYVERWTGWPGAIPDETWMVAKQASGVKDPDVLAAIAERWLEFYELGPRIERNYGLVLGYGHDPLVTYVPGDEVLIQDGTGVDPDTFDAKPDKLRVMQLTMRKSATNEWSADIVLRDRIAQRAERMERQIRGLIGGGPGVARPSRFAVPPQAPHGIAGPTDPPDVVAAIYTPEAGSGGKNYARITATGIWSGLDEDGAPCGDFDRYWLRWQYGVTKPGWNEVPGDADPDEDPSVIVDGLEPGKTIRVQVGAGDTTGHIGWSTTRSLTLPADNGEYKALDSLGTPVFRVTDAGDWFATKVSGGVLAADGPGIDLDSGQGVRLFDPAGSPAIWLDTTGNASFTGSVYIGLTLDVEGITTINDTLIVHADADFDGNVSIGSKIVFDASDGSLTLGGDLDATGQTITGAILSGVQITSGEADFSDMQATVGQVGVLGVLSIYSLSGFAAGQLTDDWNCTGDFQAVTVTETSARAGKADLRKMLDPQRLLKVPTWTFRKARDTDAPRQVGLIAEDVAAAGLEELVTRGPDGKPIGLKYSRVVAVLLDIVREQDERIERLERRG